MIIVCNSYPRKKTTSNPYFYAVTEDQMPKMGEIMKKLSAYAPHFTGPEAPEPAVKDVLSVINRSSVENGNGGTFVSHFGDKQWI